MRFESGELQDLLLAWLGVSIAFTLASAGLSIGAGWLLVLGVSALAVGLGVVLHELAHKLVANRMGYATRFVADRMMLLVGAGIALYGWIFLAPGGVRITPMPPLAQHARIAIAGPATNAGIAAISLGLLALGVPYAGYAATINAYLALFNLIPIPGFDGQAVWAHSKTWSIIGFAVSGLLLFTAFAL